MNLNNETLQKKISLVQTFIWIILIIPMIPLFFMMGVATLMMSDSGVANDLQIALIMLSCFLFWATPVLTIISVVIAFNLRKKLKYFCSIIIQLMPIVVAVFSFLILLFTTWLV